MDVCDDGDSGNMELKNMLEEWDLGHMYKHFVEQKITIKVLKILKTKHIERLFQDQPIGDQATFEHRLELWKQGILLAHHNSNIIKPSNTMTIKKQVREPVKVIEVSPFPHSTKTIITKPAVLTETPEIVYTPSVVTQISTPVTLPHSNYTTTAPPPSTPQLSNINPPITTTFSNTSFNESLNNLQQMSKNITSTPNLPVQQQQQHQQSPQSSSEYVKPPRLFNAAYVVPCRYNLRNILEETSGGQVIVSYYEKHKILREEHRAALINVIARYIDANGCGLSLSESNQLESQIVEMFPTEKEEFYRTNKRGRIYNKIANMKRVYKKFNKEPVDTSVASSTARSSPSASSYPSSPACIIKEESMDQYDEYMINEWRSSNHTSEEYYEFWKKSQQIRLKHIDDIESLQQILEQWPEYKQFNGIEFIEMDFRAKFPDATVFSDVYNANLRKLEKCLFEKVSPCSAGNKYLQQYQLCNPESKNLIILWLLHQLFPPNHKTIVDEMGNKRKKRHSIQDSQNAFMCIRGSQSSLETAVQYYQSTVTPPMILVVGELAHQVDQVFVYFEGVQFPMDNVVQAAQLCCELYFLFNLDYPEEALLFYSFCQTFFLNIEPEFKNTKIYTIINEINAN